MATKFQVFSGSAEDRNQFTEEASTFIAQVEAEGGEYVDSHSAVTNYNLGVLYTLTVVYRDAPAPKRTSVRAV